MLLNIKPGDSLVLDWAAKAWAGPMNEQYKKRRRYIRGDHPLEFATPTFRSAFGSQFKAFSYNRCGTVVDAHADRLQVIGFDAGEDTEDAEGESEALAQEAQDIWDRNLMPVREGEVEKEMFGLGDGYAIVEVDPNNGDILIWPQRPEAIRILYSQERPGERIAAAKQWVDDRKRRRLTIYYRDRVEKYVADGGGVAVLQMGSSSKWRPIEIPGEPWPVPLLVKDTVPVFHFANNAGVGEYGVSELHDVMPLQDALNKTNLDMMVAMEFSAFPQRVVLNVDDSDPANTTALKEFVAGLTRILNLIGIDGESPPSISEFSATNITQYTQVIELFDKMISRVSRVPVHYLQMSGAPQSGTAKRLDEAPFTAKIEDRQKAAAAVWEDLIRYGLRLRGRDVPPGKIKVKWQPAAPLSREESIRLALLEQELGLPMREILRNLGKDSDDIDELIEEIEEEGSQSQTLALGAGLGPVPLVGD